MSSRRWAIAGLAVVFLAAAPVDEGELLKQIKSDVFDQSWDGVLTNCDQFISRYGSSAALPRAYYYRAQALEHMKGREAEAITAYDAFITKFPSETGALKEDALLSRMTLTVSLYLKGDRTHVDVIMKGMDEKGYPRLYAAIQASKIEYTPARAKALPILKECVRSERDAELRNECVLAILRIEPGALPAGPTGPPVPPSPPGKNVGPRPPVPPPGAPGSEVKLIRVEVFDKLKKQVAVRVNLPIAFAELLLDSLGETYRGELEQQFKQKGMVIGDPKKFWDALKVGGPQVIVEIDNDENHIKVWVE